MVLNNLVDKVDRCNLNLNHHCGRHSLLESLGQTPWSNVPTYLAALEWLNGTSSKLPFTSDDVIKQNVTICSPKCVWGTCQNGSCICFNGFSGSTCNTTNQNSYLKCAPNKTRFGMSLNGVSDWSSELVFTNVIII